MKKMSKMTKMRMMLKVMKHYDNITNIYHSKIIVPVNFNVSRLSVGEPDVKDRKRKGLFISDLILCIVVNELEGSKKVEQEGWDFDSFAVE